MKELRSALPYLRPYRVEIAFGLLLVVVTNAFGATMPWVVKLAVDALSDPTGSAPVPGGISGALTGWADALGPHRMAGFAILLVLLALFGGAAKYGMRELLNGYSRKVECDLRHAFFRRLLELDAPFYASTRTGDLMSRATNDTLAVRQAVGPAVMYTVNTLVGFAFALTLMLRISPMLTGLALIPMVLVPPITLGFGRVIHQRFEKIQEQFSTLSTMVQENLTGVRIVRAYGQEDPQAAEFDALNREYMRRNLDLVKKAGLFHPILALITGLGMVIVLWVGGRLAIDGTITIGDFVAFGIYLALLTWPMIALGWVVNLFQRGDASMGRLNRIMGTEVALRGGEGALPAIRGEVEFDGVSFRYPGTDRLVLRDVSFRARAGETIAVVGPTGSGKSTLVSLIPRLYDPTSGKIRLDGRPLTDFDPSEVRRRVGMVPQDAFLFSETIADNIGLGLDRAGTAEPREPGVQSLPIEEDPDEAIHEAARIAQLHDSIEGFPKGYGTYLGERGINLSGGQKQRATLARAVARDPAILVLDDALSAVDTQTEARILDDLKRVLAGRTSFIVSHRLSAVKEADQILVLEDGEVVERGTHAELIERDGTYARLLRRQMIERDLEAEAEVVA